MSSLELLRELLLKVKPGSSFKFEVGSIMLIKSYYLDNQLRFRVEVESHRERTFDNVDDALIVFNRYWKQ